VRQHRRRLSAKDALSSSAAYLNGDARELAFRAGGKPEELRLEALHVEKQMVTSNPLIGTCRLLSWENRDADGHISHPLGEDAVGFIMYNGDGYMFVAIMRPGRVEFSAGDLLSGSTREKAQAAGTYVSYCGRYEFHGETAVHHVELSLFPNWVGVDQERRVEIAGDRLTLSTHPILLGGSQRTARLIWERI
jgi:hypothetical protein